MYNDWSAYDELSDNIPLSEELAMKELDNVIRLKKDGVRIDYYVMDAFWFDVDGGYRTWDKKNWPNGPDRWLKACKAAGVKPGFVVFDQSDQGRRKAHAPCHPGMAGFSDGR